MFNNIAEPPDNIGGKNLKPGDYVYHWKQPGIIYQIEGEPKWGKDGGDLIILDYVAKCVPHNVTQEDVDKYGVKQRKFSTFDLVKVEIPVATNSIKPINAKKLHDKEAFKGSLDRLFGDIDEILRNEILEAYPELSNALQDVNKLIENLDVD